MNIKLESWFLLVKEYKMTGAQKTGYLEHVLVPSGGGGGALLND